MLRGDIKTADFHAPEAGVTGIKGHPKTRAADVSHDKTDLLLEHRAPHTIF